MDQVRPAAGPGDPYKNPELFRWLDSLEGVPDWLGPAETDVERASWAGWQRRGNHIFGLIGTTMPGLALALLIAMAGRVLANLPNAAFGFEKTPLSPILVAILLGALKKVLRIGVALLGIRLSLAATGAIGLVALPIVICCIATALFLVTRVGAAVGLPPRLATLIAVGTAICGNSAIVAMAPVIEATDDEVSYAVGCITVFGLVALIFYPFVGHYLFDGEASLIGLFMGTAIHDTAQVAGAGMVYLAQFGVPEVLDTATVTKLQRNMFMLAVIPLMAFHSNRERSSGSIRSQVRAALPMFVFGFLAMSLLRTVGDLGERPFGVLSPEVWTMLIGWATKTATLCLAVAMAAVGLGTSFTRLRGLGLRPLGVGLFAAAVVGGVSYILVRTFAPYIIELTG